MTIDFIKKSVDYRRREVAWQKKYDRLAPKKGDLAPDFELFDTEGENSVRLSDHTGEIPVALVFGSYT